MEMLKPIIESIHCLLWNEKRQNVEKCTSDALSGWTWQKIKNSSTPRQPKPFTEKLKRQAISRLYVPMMFRLMISANDQDVIFNNVVEAKLGQKNLVVESTGTRLLRGVQNVWWKSQWYTRSTEWQMSVIYNFCLKPSLILNNQNTSPSKLWYKDIPWWRCHLQRVMQSIRPNNNMGNNKLVQHNEHYIKESHFSSLLTLSLLAMFFRGYTQTCIDQTFSNYFTLAIREYLSVISFSLSKNSQSGGRGLWFQSPTWSEFLSALGWANSMTV